MVNLKNIPGLSALHGTPQDSAPIHDNSKGEVIISDSGLIDKINLRTNPDNDFVSKMLRYVVGTDLPTKPNTVNVVGKNAVVWLGPDEWLILGETGLAENILATLNVPEAGHIAAVEISDALGALGLEGPHARDVLAKHCAIDFHPAAFSKGMVAQSLMAQAGVTIICNDSDNFLIIGRTSFMPYLLDLLKDAALEYGFEYQPC